MPTAHARADDVAARAGLLTAAWVGMPLSLVGFATAPASYVRPLGHWFVTSDAARLRRTLLAAARGRAAPVAALADAVAWHSPLRASSDPDDLQALVADLERLGLAATGVLTTAGRALSAVLSEPEPSPAEVVRRVTTAWRSVLPAPVSEVTLVPDLTAVALGTPSPELRELLDSAADLDGGGAVWRFSRASIRRALDRGTDADELLTTLGRSAPRGVPGTLRALVEDVARAHGRVRVGAATCYVRCDDAALAAEVVRDRKLAALGLRQIIPGLLVGTAEPDRTVRTLRTAGYLPWEEDEDLVPVLVRPPEAPRAPEVRWRPLDRADAWSGWRRQEPGHVVRQLRDLDARAPASRTLPARPNGATVLPGIGSWGEPPRPRSSEDDLDEVADELLDAAPHLGPDDVQALADCLVEGTTAVITTTDAVSLVVRPLRILSDHVLVTQDGGAAPYLLPLRVIELVDYAWSDDA